MILNKEFVFLDPSKLVYLKSKHRTLSSKKHEAERFKRYQGRSNLYDKGTIFELQMTMRMIKTTMLILSSAIYIGVFAQDADIRQVSDNPGVYRIGYTSKSDTAEKEVKKGTIRYIQSERIETFGKYLEKNPSKHMGFRIQLVFGSKAEIQKAKSKFYGRYELPLYDDYLAPNYRLRAGNFMTKFEAERMLNELKKSFPASYIVKDRIEVPRAYR